MRFETLMMLLVGGLMSISAGAILLWAVAETVEHLTIG